MRDSQTVSVQIAAAYLPDGSAGVGVCHEDNEHAMSVTLTISDAEKVLELIAAAMVRAGSHNNDRRMNGGNEG